MYPLQEAFWRIPPNLSALDLRNIVSGLALDENNVPIAADRIKMKSSAPKPKQKEKKRKKEKKGDNDRKKKNAGKFAALRELVKKKADAKKTKRLVYLNYKGAFSFWLINPSVHLSSISHRLLEVQD